MNWRVFDAHADRYDAWFDSAEGSKIFEAEVECLDRVLPSDRTDWTEVGAGTGRFAAALGIPKGVEPSAPMLEKAKERGISAEQARAEDLPYEAESVPGILLVVTLCFLDDPESALAECVRVLQPGGRLLVGIVPAESSWGEFYRDKADAGHAFYSVARFYTCRQTTRMARRSGLKFVSAASTLHTPPGEVVDGTEVRSGAKESSGFAAMLFEKEDKS